MRPRLEVLLVAAEPVPGPTSDARRIMHRAECLAHHGGGALMAPAGSETFLPLTGVHRLSFDLPPGATPAQREVAIGTALQAQIPRLKPKVVHCFGVHLAVPALLHAWKGNTVLVEPGLTPAQRLRDEQPPWPAERIADLVRLEDQSISRADAIVARSATEAATLIRRGARSDRIWTVRDGVPEVKRTPLPDMPHLLFVGDIGPGSGWELLVTALGRLKGPWRATFAVGRGPVAALTRRLRYTRLDRRVTVTGLDDLEPRLAASRIVVCPAEPGRALSSGAWLPQAVLWALAAGRALIAPDMPGIRAYAGGAAAYYTPGSAHALTVGLERLLKSPGITAELAEDAVFQARRCRWTEAETAIRSLWTRLADSLDAHRWERRR